MQNSLRLLVGLVLLALSALAWSSALAQSAGAVTAAPDPFGFRESEYSAWGIVDADYPYTGRVGCFPVGNGVIFATLGVDPDFNQLGSLTGPGYQTRDDSGAVSYWQEGNWPAMPVYLVRVTPDAGAAAGYRYERVAWQRQSIQQLRGAAMVRTIQRNGDLALYCMTYAVPGTPGLARQFRLLGAQPGEVYGLAFDRSQARFDAHQDQAQGDKRLIPVASANFYQQERQGLTVIQGWTDPRQPEVLQFGLSLLAFKAAAMYEDAEDEDSALKPGYMAVLDAWAASYYGLDATRDYWREWSSHNLQFDTGDSTTDDLLAQLPVTIETQRDAYSGGYSPLVNYHGYWVRDSLGPIYVNLLNGRFDTVQRMLTYHRKACWKLGSCSMLVPLDIDVSDVEEPVGDLVGAKPCYAQIENEADRAKHGFAPTSDAGGTSAAPTKTWDAIPVEHAEVPSLIVLQHYWLWKCMRAAGQGDAADAFIAQAWPFIAHNLFAMQFDPTYGVRFHGDETYTNGALYSTFDSGAPGELGYPNGYIPTEFFSFDNTMLHRGAATAMGEMAQALGDKAVQPKAEELEHQLTGIISNYSRGKLMGYGPAISPVTHGIWQWPFSNITLSPWALGVPWPADAMPQGAEDLWIHFLWSDAFLKEHYRNERQDSPIAWWTTEFSGCTTGHAIGGWLNAARSNENSTACSNLTQQLLLTATPEGAWCEVYDAQAQPVNVYGRVNRIRPWESGINYAMLVGELAEQGAVQVLKDQHVFSATLDVLVRSADQATHKEHDYWQSEWNKREHTEYTYFPFGIEPAPASDTTKVLVLTRDNHYQQVLKQDRRLTSITDQEICPIDIAEPYSPVQLQRLMLDSQPSLNESEPDRILGLRIPYVYLDRDVKRSDRRTFKTQKFWDELKPVLAEYQAAGGQVLDEDALQVSLGDDEAVGLKVLLVLYPRTFCWEMDAEAIANFHKETAKWISWYDEVAGDKLKLQLDFLQIDRRLPPRACGPQGSNVYWMGYDGVEADLLARGIERGKYDSVCCFWAWDRQTPSLPDGSLAAQAYGGAAQGPGSDMAFLGAAGRTSYYGAAVLKSHFVTTGRVALHEFLHNLDAMFSVAGMDDEFFSSDDMEAHMPQLLKERPGVFAPYGYDDAAMLALAEKSRTGEAGFPWRTQLEYYKWCLERTPRSDYARLLKRFGARVPVGPRVALYDSFILPQGEQPYQIVFDVGAALVPPASDVGAKPCFAHPDNENRAKHGFAPTGLNPITIEDIDTDGYVHWRSAASGGVLSEPWPQPVRFYAEAELVAPDQQQILLGRDAAVLRVELRDSVTHQPLPGASVSATLAGQTIALADAGDGSYTAAVPAGLEQDTDVAYTAQLPGNTISEQLCALRVKPVWTASLEYRDAAATPAPSGAPSQPNVHVSVSGPPGEYWCTLKSGMELNTVEQMLVDDGVIAETQGLDAQFSAGEQTEIDMGMPREHWEALQYCSVTLQIDCTPPGYGLPLGAEKTSFTQRIAPTLPMSNLLGGIDPARLPAYIPRARRMTPGLDGKLDEWSLPPSLSLDQATGHGFGPGFKSAGDGAVQLWLAYDDSMLYVAGTVADDMLKTGDMWGSDRLNLVFDAALDTTRATYPQGAVGHTGWTRDDYWVLLCPFVRGPEGAPQPLTERLGGELPGGGKAGYFGDLAGAQARVAQGEGGYSFEWALPLASLPYMTPRPGGFCGFTFFLSDHDAGLNELMYLNNWWGSNGIEWRFWDCGLLYFEP